MKKMLFAVFAIALIAGCTSGSGPGLPGLTIKEFEFSPNSLLGAQKTSLSLVVQNTGEVDITNAYASIYGFGEVNDLWILDGTQKNIVSGAFTLRSQGTLAAAAATTGGEEKKFIWLMHSNDEIPKDATRSYTANARVCYPYSTTALGRVEIMSENEWMSRNNPQHEIIVSQRTAPVRITVLSKQPIIQADKVSLELLIENVGGGTVASEGYCAKVYGTGTASANAQSSSDLNRLALEVSGITTQTCDQTLGTVFLEQGKSEKVTVECAMGSGTLPPIATADVKISMKYNYYLDSKAIVRVKGPTKRVEGPVTPVTPPVTPPTPTELTLPQAAIDGTMLVNTVKVDSTTLTPSSPGTYMRTGSCTATANIDVFVEQYVGDPNMKQYAFNLDLSSNAIKVTHNEQTKTMGLGTVNLLKNNVYGVRVSQTTAPGGCTFSTQLYCVSSTGCTIS